MSQRLHIGATKDGYYDCVLTSEEDAPNKLLEDWLRYDGKFTIGPYKIRIVDRELWKAIEPIIEDIFYELGHRYPEAIWFFYEGSRELEHPTRAELDAWLNQP